MFLSFHANSNQFFIPTFVATYGSFRGKIIALDSVLSSHEQRSLTYYLAELKVQSLNFKRIGTIALTWDRLCCFYCWNWSKIVFTKSKKNKEFRTELREGRRWGRKDSPIPLISQVQLNKFFSMLRCTSTFNKSKIVMASLHTNCISNSMRAIFNTWDFSSVKDMATKIILMRYYTHPVLIAFRHGKWKWFDL